jgi:hypothetical protein
LHLYSSGLFVALYLGIPVVRAFRIWKAALLFSRGLRFFPYLAIGFTAEYPEIAETLVLFYLCVLSDLGGEK